MASFYSSFFSAGLLAAHPDGSAADSSRATTPVADPTTPRPRHRSLEETTPTTHGESLPASSSSNNVIPSLVAQGGSRPSLRRRRSSLSVAAASPAASIKSSAQTVRTSSTVQLQRHSLGIASPGRVRSGSVTEAGLISRVAVMSVSATTNTTGNATKGTGLLGRLRSGSVGAALKSRRLRKSGSVLIPAPPPPTAPLPAVPPVPAAAIPANRTPNRRARTAESLPSPLVTPTGSVLHSRGTTPLAGERMYFGSPLTAGTVRSMSLDEHEMMLDGDYPSPLDTPGSLRDEYFGSDIVLAL